MTLICKRAFAHFRRYKIRIKNVDDQSWGELTVTTPHYAAALTTHVLSFARLGLKKPSQTPPHTHSEHSH